MSSEIEGSDGVSGKQVAQHWVMTSERPVDDGAYSTIYSAGVSITLNEPAFCHDSDFRRQLP